MSRKLTALLGAGAILLLFACNKNPEQYEKYLPTNPNAHPSDSDAKVTYYIGNVTSKVPQFIPSDFLGLSFETETLVHYDYFNVDHGSFIQLVQSLGTGILRIGAGSADHAYWNVGKHGSNADSTWLTPADIDRYLTWAGMTGWRTMFTLNLGTAPLSQNVAMAKYIMSNYFAGNTSLEIGNEPDLFAYNHLRPAGYSFEQYKNEFNDRYTAIKAAVPEAVFSGPSTAGTSWVLPFVQKESDRISMITSHFYALGMGADSVVSIDKLLDGNIGAVTEADKLNYTASQYGIPYRINETSSVNGAVDGVSNTFASALWAVDYMYTLAEHGAAGVNFHGGGDDAHTPIAHVNGAFVARPLYYGMLLFSKGAPGRLLSVQKGPGDTANVTAHAVYSNDGKVKVTLVNKGSQPAIVGLSIAGGPYSYAFVLRLTAPSVDATSGVSFGGSAMTPGGTWAPPTTYETAALDKSYCAVKLPAYSAALVTLK